MKNITGTLLVVGMLVLIAGSAAAAPITGIWHGNLRFDPAKFPNDPDQKARKIAMANMKQAQQLKFMLTLKGDYSYSILILGGTKQIPTIYGKWSQNGNSVMLQESRGGRLMPSQSFTLSKDGKNLSFVDGPRTIAFYR